MRFNNYLHILSPSSINLANQESRSVYRYRRATWTALLTGTARCVSVIAGLISVRLTLYYLGAERFGLWMTITAAVSMLQFADFGIGNGLLNRIAEASGNNDRESIRILISSGMVLLAIIAIILIGIFIIINKYISWPAVFNAKSPVAIFEVGKTTFVLVIIFALNVALSVIIRVNMALQQGYINGVYQIFGNILGLLALIVSIKLKAGLPVLVASYMFGPVLATVANGFYLFLYKCPWAKPSLRHLDISIARDLLVLGVWFLLLQVVVTFNNAIPNLVISHILGLEYVSIFAIAFKLAGVAVIIQTVIVAPLWPAYAEARTSGDWSWLERTLKKNLMLCGAIGLITSIVMVVFGSPIIRIWAGSDFVPPRGVLWGLGAWVLTCSLHGPLTIFLNGMGRIRIQSLYGIIFSVFMLCFCIFLTKYFNLAGSAWAFGSAYSFPSLIFSSVIVLRIMKSRRSRL